MKRLLFALFCIIIFSATTCKKNSDDCHKELIIKNNSSDTVILAQISYYGSLCNLDGGKLPPKKEEILAHRDCWEDIVSSGGIKDIYIIDPTKFNNPLVFYECDSIEIKNKVLRHYLLNIDTLRKNNFTISYP